MTQRKVTEIPATIRKFTAMPINGLQKRRVAGYARVSTDHEEQVRCGGNDAPPVGGKQPHLENSR